MVISLPLVAPLFGSAAVDGVGSDLAGLPPDWFARYAAQQMSPVRLTWPVEFAWQISEARVPLLHDGKVICIRQELRRALLNAGRPGNPSLPLLIASAPQTLVCVDARTGETIWEHAFENGNLETPRRPAAFDRYLLVTVSTAPQACAASASAPGSDTLPAAMYGTESIWLMDLATGRILRRWGPRPIGTNTGQRLPGTPASGPAAGSPPAPIQPLTPEQLRERIKARLAEDPLARARQVMFQALRERQPRIASTYFASPNPVLDVSLDPGAWTWEDAHRVLEVLTDFDVRLHGVGGPGLGLGEHCTFINGREVLAGIGNDLGRWNVETGEAIWKTPLEFAPGAFVLWHPPLAAARVGRSEIAAFDAETGQPRWRYRWPDIPMKERYRFAMTALQDGVLILANPVIDRPFRTIRDPVSGGVSVQQDDRLCLIKLDEDGKKIFWQELEIGEGYARMLVEDDLIVVYGSNAVAGFTPAPDPEKLVLSDEIATPEFQRAQQIANLHAKFDSLPLHQRAGVCMELGRLGDKTMFARLVAEYENSDKKDKIEYIHLLGRLADPQAIPWLIDRLADADDATTPYLVESLQMITGKRLTDPPRWRAWWQQQAESRPAQSLSAPAP